VDPPSSQLNSRTNSLVYSQGISYLSEARLHGGVAAEKVGFGYMKLSQLIAKALQEEHRVRRVGPHAGGAAAEAHHS
jgi:hypothetical protein